MDVRWWSVWFAEAGGLGGERTFGYPLKTDIFVKLVLDDGLLLDEARVCT